MKGSCVADSRAFGRFGITLMFELCVLSMVCILHRHIAYIHAHITDKGIAERVRDFALSHGIGL